MKKIFTTLTIAVAMMFSACTAMYFPVSDNGYNRNSIYYASVDEVSTSVSDTLTLGNESYATKLHKFDNPTYTIELNLTPWYPTYYTNYWRWNSWCLSPFIYENIYWSWSWRPYYYYDYWGYYNPYRYSYRYYYPYRSYWDWHRPYYTYYHHKPSHRPGRDVYYTRRGGVTPRPKVPSFDGNQSRNHEKYRRSTANPPRKPAQVSRRDNRSNNTNYRSKTPVNRSNNTNYRPGNQSQRTGYGRSTTSTIRRNDTYNRPQQRPSERYTPQRSNTGYSQPSRSSNHGSSQSSGSSTRRK